jgi:hypothetical protein
MSKMEKRYTKKDFYVGQEVYAECVNLGGRTILDKGEITKEVVTRVGNKYVTTNKRTYLIASGVEKDERLTNFVLWNNKNEAKDKVTKDKVFSKLISLFRLDSGSLQNQKLYKELSLEDLQEIERIIDKAMERE